LVVVVVDEDQGLGARFEEREIWVSSAIGVKE